MTYTGDILIQQLSDGTYDIVFQNGQPDMTDGLETLVLLAVFGSSWWGNEIVQTESEKMKSDFPDVIKRGIVSDKTKNDGTKAIEKSLAFMMKDKIAKKVTVTGEIISVYGIGWLIEIEAIKDQSIKFFINWEKGELTAKFANNG